MRGSVRDRRFVRNIRASVVVSLLGSVILLLLFSCAPSEGFDAGHPITPEELASVSSELFSPNREPAETDGETVSRDPNCVYWVKGGSVYHFDPDCRHIRDAEDVIRGTFRTAEWMYGIEKPCSTCGGD